MTSRGESNKQEAAYLMRSTPPDERLYPSRTNKRRYHLSQMRKALEEAVEKHLPGGGLILVDMGCGGSPYKPLLAPCAKNYIGVDLPGNPIADLFFDEKGRAALPDETADVALSIQVLEHVEDPASYLAECRRLLKPGGRLILTTHGHWKFHPDPADFRRWTSMGLRKDIEYAGFDVLDFSGIVSLGASGIQLLQDDVLGRFPRVFRNLSIRIFQSLMWFVDRLSSDEQRNRDSGTYLVVASKPANIGAPSC